MVKRNRIKLLAAVLLVFLSNSHLAYAGTTERTHSTDLKEIREISGEILEFANNCYEDMYTKTPASEDDLDYANAYMIYTDADIFADETISSEILQEKLELLPVIWFIPVLYEDAVCTVGVSRGLPLREDNMSILTDEQIAEIRNKEGEWVVSSAGFEEVNWQQEAEDLLADETADITLIGGVPGVYSPVALVTNAQDVQGIMPLNDDLTLKKGALYSPQEIAAVVQKELKNREKASVQDVDNAVVGDGENGVNGYGVAGLLVIAAVLVYGVRRYYTVC